MNDISLTRNSPSTVAEMRSPEAVRGMVRIPGGRFTMGSAEFYPEERPTREAAVEPFWMDPHPVTVAEFRRFVKATGYVTVAERRPNPADYPDADPSMLVPGALVFGMPERKVPLEDWWLWWAYVPGADWRHPHGPDSAATGRDQHPVTQVSYADALAYADWLGRELPNEAEWEFAARGGLARAVYGWGDDFTPDGRRMANVWHGEFPWEYQPGPHAGDQPDTTPVRTYPPNDFGLFDMTGNVWEWTSDHFTADHSQTPGKGSDPEPGERFPRRVVKGGSHLCSANYSLRYRPAARQGQTEDTATSDLGFRCVVRERDLR